MLQYKAGYTFVDGRQQPSAPSKSSAQVQLVADLSRVLLCRKPFVV